MNILLACMSMGLGGAETHVYSLACALRSLGHGVTVASRGGVLADKLAENGIKQIFIPLDKADIFTVCKCRAVIGGLLKSGEYDIVHAHARIPAFVCAPVCKKHGVHFVTTVHAHFKGGSLLRALSRWGEHCFAVSPDLAYYLTSEYSYPSDNITVINNGIDTSLYSPLQDGKSDGITVLHVSRLDKETSLCARELILSAEKICAKHENVSYRIVGSGDSIDGLRLIADRINGALGRKAISLTGASDDIPAVLREADIFVGPSRAALEAMSCALPCIVSGSEGHIGVFSDKTEKLCISTNFCGRGEKKPTAETLADEIEYLIGTKKEEREALGIYARDYVRKNYSLGKMAETHSDVYESINARNRNGNPDILICGYYGFDNIGDDALLLSMINGIRARVPDADICVMSHTPKKTAERFGVRAINRYDIIKTVSLMKKAKCFVFSGGNLLQDKTSTKSLVYYAYILKLAGRYCAHSLVTANGVGPISRKKNELLALRALKTAESCSMRDEASVKLLENAGIPSRLTFDPAITLKPRASFPKPKGKYFVIAPKELSYGVTDALFSLCAFMKEKHGLDAVIVPMDAKKDTAVCKRLASSVPYARIYKITGASQLISLFSGAEFSVCSRLHALILSTLSLCPFLALTDDGKLASYADRVNMMCVNESAEKLIGLCEKLISGRTEAVKRMSASLPGYVSLAESEFDFIAEYLK